MNEGLNAQMFGREPLETTPSAAEEKRRPKVPSPTKKEVVVMSSLRISSCTRMSVSGPALR
eukprot:8663103-Lingulodinium_polyedra.AAC.1